MVRVVGILRSLEQVPPWPDRQAIAAGLEDGRLGHRIRRADHEVRDPDLAANLVIPESLRDMWRAYARIELFVDLTYGQYGVQLFDAADTHRETRDINRLMPDLLRNDDLVIGRLLGLSDLVVMPTDPGSADLGFILIANPLDKRTDWPVAAPSLVGFLERLVDADGDSFWAHG